MKFAKGGIFTGKQELSAEPGETIIPHEMALKIFELDDIVQVVRCKDCKYAEKDGIHQVSLKCTRFRTGMFTHRRQPDDFCSSGERRNDG